MAKPKAPVELAGAPTSVQTPTWTHWYEIFRVVGHRPYLKKTIGIALMVGTVLFIINHLDEVIAGKATHAVWIKSGLTCFVPFVVSNLGLLVAARRPQGAVAGRKDNL